jgi:hypothetical protein
MRAIWNIAQDGVQRQSRDSIWLFPKDYGLVAPSPAPSPFDRKQYGKIHQICGLNKPATAKAGGQNHA